MKTASLVHDDELELRREYLAGMGHALETRLQHAQQELRVTLDELLRIKREWDALSQAIERRRARGH